MRRSWLLNLVLTVVASVALQTCSSVYETTALDVAAPQRQEVCRGNTGTYFLPKSELQFLIVEHTENNARSYEMKTEDNKSDGPAIVPVADKRQQHCLQFLASGFYTDNIRVKRTDNGLLANVYSNVKDETPTIVEKAAEGISMAVAAQSPLANRDFAGGTAQGVIKMSMQFDPFDVDLMTQVNSALDKYGYCVYIDPSNDPFVPFWMRNQCTSQKQYRPSNLKGDASEVFETASFTAGDGRYGILYKPALSHTLIIMRKDDPTSSNPWRAWRREIVEMPNRAPVFMLQVSRGFFTGRTTDISFNNGMLASVKVQKTSELKAVSDALVSVVGVVVQIPAKALIIGTTDAENQAALIKANQALLQAYSQLEADQKKRANLQDGLNEDGSPRSSLDRVTRDCLAYADTSGIDNPRAKCFSEAAQNGY